MIGKFDPEFFGNTGKPYSIEDVRYLIEWYDIIGLKEMAYALERTPISIKNKVIRLRNQGLMKSPKKSITENIRKKANEIVNLYLNSNLSALESIQIIANA